MYSLDDGSLAKTIERPYDPRPIEQEDGQLPIRKMTISGLGKGEGLHNYPPIFHLNYTGKGNLLVWTSQRDASGRQVVDVYDAQLKKFGTDLKFMNLIYPTTTKEDPTDEECLVDSKNRGNCDCLILHLCPECSLSSRPGANGRREIRHRH